MPTLEQAAPRSRLARFNEIVQILIRNDFWGLLRDLSAGPEAPRPPAEGDVVVEDHRPPAPLRVRRMLEELGPSFIKIGQLLATRPDLVPPAYVDELRKLYDQTTPSPPEDVRRVLRSELGREPEAVFATFDPAPLASASIGQVHRATLRDGTPVAVKVQHSGIEEAMALDFQILRSIVRFIERTFARTRVWQPSRHLEELRLMLERELDYRYEMRNAQRVAGNFRGDPTVHVPAVFEALCTRRVLVMEFVEGIKFTNLQDARLQSIDRARVARIVTHAMARQIFLHRIFHADPSPGNLLILSSDRVAFLDFGAVGIVTERRARTILRLITSISRGDAEETAEAIVDLCEQRGEHDSKRFQADVERLLDFFEREDVSVADPRLMEMILDLAKRHRMLLPADFVLITRALFQFEGFCRALDPNYELVAVLQPLSQELLWEELSSQGKRRQLFEDTLGETARLLRTLPHALNTIVRKVERNELSVRVEAAGLEGLKSSQGRGVLKTSLTIMLAAIVVGLAIVIAGPAPERTGSFLFLAGAVMAVWLVVMVVWSESFKGKHD